jgi:uncharacterized membrane protein YfcA
MTATAITRRETSADRLLRLVPGLAAGMAFAMWAMFVGIFASKLWAPPQGIAQSVGIGAQGWDFQIVPSILGSVLGGFIGTRLQGRVSERASRRFFAVLFAAIGVTFLLAFTVFIHRFG